MRGAWSAKVRNDDMPRMAAFIEVAGDRPITEHAKEDARAFKAVVLQLPANRRKTPLLKDLRLRDVAEKVHELGLFAATDTKVANADISAVR